jgi:HupE / UreJ protein
LGCLHQFRDNTGWRTLRTAILLIVWLICVMRASAHDILRSESNLQAGGRTVRAMFILNLFELKDPVVPGNPRATVAQLDESIGKIFDSIERHYFLRTPDAPVRTTLGQYTLVDGNVVHMEVLYFFERDIAALEITSTLYEIMPPGHRLLAAVMLNGALHEAILDAGTTRARFTGTSATPWSTVWRFGRLGVEHIFTGYDHLAFLMGLLVATTTLGSLVKVITSFTVAHSITLALATFGAVTLPSRLTESLIAVSIGYIAAENLLDFRVMPRYYITFFFGLIHGFGFSNVLRDMQLPHSGLVLSLFSFNAGVEIGQIAIVLLIFPLMRELIRSGWRLKPAVSAAIGCLAVYWFVQRAFA